MPRSKSKPKFCEHDININFCRRCKKPATPFLPRGPGPSLASMSDDQKLAVARIINEPGPFFLTGPAGSGKSYVVEYLRHVIKNCWVTATTGTAAQLIRGRTVFWFAGIIPRQGLSNSWRARSRVANCEALIIDEASMMDEELLGLLFARFEETGGEPKLILVGDFMQLPPVSGKPIFRTEAWKRFKTIKLTGQHRQKDGGFLSVLNDIRIGNLSDSVRAFIKEHKVDVLPDDCTQLMARRDDVDRRNNARLEALPGQLYTSRWKLSPSSAYKDANTDPRKAEIATREMAKARLVSELRIKVGARVLLLTNEKDGLWVNGSTGMVTAVRPGTVSVRLDNKSLVDVGRAEEEVVDSAGETICTISQYPIMLGYAVSIHRAQGVSLDRVGIDLDNHFETGQSYVAISRCRFAEGLFLTGDLGMIKVDETALALGF